MGKLKSLWAELRITKDSEKRKDLQKAINDIQIWMRDEKGIDITPTNWNTQFGLGKDWSERFNDPKYPQETNVVFIEDLDQISTKLK